MRDLEDALCRFEQALTASGELEAAGSLLGLRTATVAAVELMAAYERADMEAIRFHTDLLERQIREARPLRFKIDG
ncbi:hypothetical protein C8D88_10811 [Lentzea atacamensis]|uniref:Uncharacterized protein n=1 Tax=Lentzea atacamensis TaxID=531938 RepID=A0A316HUW8_9PSEU|nr:hypothetical protein [Lentzea atacamensis]PWK84396.1 hypothetical protein C8D88_10811 [Lentzea atacamensis]